MKFLWIFKFIEKPIKIAMQWAYPDFWVTHYKIYTLHPEIVRPTSKSISTIRRPNQK